MSYVRLLIGAFLLHYAFRCFNSVFHFILLKSTESVSMTSLIRSLGSRASVELPMSVLSLKWPNRFLFCSNSVSTCFSPLWGRVCNTLLVLSVFESECRVGDDPVWCNVGNIVFGNWRHSPLFECAITTHYECAIACHLQVLLSECSHSSLFSPCSARNNLFCVLKLVVGEKSALSKIKCNQSTLLTQLLGVPFNWLLNISNSQ